MPHRTPTGWVLSPFSLFEALLGDDVTVELSHDEEGHFRVHVSPMLKLGISILAACIAIGGGIIGHAVSVAHHDQQVDDAIQRLDSTIMAIRAEQQVNSEARVRMIEQFSTERESNRRLQDDLDEIHRLMLENRVLLQKHDNREIRDHAEEHKADHSQ